MHDYRLRETGRQANVCHRTCFFYLPKQNGLWTVRFSSSPRVFNYNPSRLLYLTHPDTINLREKGLYINNKHINNVAELLRFTDGRYIFYRVTYDNGYYENLEGNEVYITRTPIDKNGGAILGLSSQAGC